VPICPALVEGHARPGLLGFMSCDRPYVTSAPKAVFLSYASQDAEAARHICEALQAMKVEVWFDPGRGPEPLPQPRLHGDRNDDRDGHARRGLFARLAKNTSPDVDAVEVRFRQPFPRFKQPFPINRAASSDRPDLLLRGMRDGRDVCWIVLEAKIASGEGLQQLRRYRCQCARAKRKKQIRAYDLYYVTPVPRTASDRTFHNLTHGSLVAMIDKCLSDPAPARNEHFDVAWAALHDRLKHLASIQPNDTDTVLPWLEREERFATRDVRCTLLVRHIAPTGYLSYGGYLDTHGHAQYLLILTRELWETGRSFKEKGKHRLAECVSIHLELEIPADFSGTSVPMRLHFETVPYMPRRELKRLSDCEDLKAWAVDEQLREFNGLRERLRAQLREHLHGSGRRWRLSGHALQLAYATVPLNRATTIAELRVALQEVVDEIGEVVEPFARSTLYHRHGGERTPA